MAAAISPQPLAVGEVIQKAIETTTNNNPKLLYADQLRPKEAAASKFELVPVTIVHGEPTIEFSMDEIKQFTREEGLHQAVIMKFSYGKPDLQEFRKVFSSQFDIQGRCNIGLLEFRHLLIRFDLYNDYVMFLSRSTGYVKAKGDDFFFRTFPWTLEFNPKEETSMAVVWISFPGLPPNFFAKRSLMSIASAVGKALAVDKATQERTRPSAARVKVILDLLDKHPKKVKILMVDKATGKTIAHYQEVVYDKLPKYCTYCKHQGHDDKACRLLKEQGVEEMAKTASTVERNLPVIDVTMTEQMQGDARDYLNNKRAEQRALGTIHAEVAAKTGQEIVTLQQENAEVTGTKHAEVVAKTGKEIVPPQHENAEVTGTINAEVVAKTGKEIVPLQHENAEVTDTIHAEVVAKTGQEIFPLQHEKAEVTPQVQTANQFAILGVESNETNAHPTYRDVPARRALDTISNVVNPIVQAYDKLASATAILASGTVTGAKIDCVEAVEQVRNVEEVIPGDENVDGKCDDTPKKGEKWEVVSARKSPTKKAVSHKSAGDRQNLSNCISSSNNFELLAALDDGQLVSCTKSEKGVKDSENLSMEEGKQILMKNSVKEFNIPTLHFSNPHVDQIIKEAQSAMMLNTTMVKQPLVTLNTSVFEIPSQSLESCGEHGGDQGQLVVSTGNNDEVIKANVKAMMNTSKLWADQPEYDDEEDWDVEFAEDSSYEGERCSGDEEMLSVSSPSFPKNESSSKVGSGSKLNAKAPDFIPKSRKQHNTTGAFSASNYHGQQIVSSSPAASPVMNLPGQQQLSSSPAASPVMNLPGQQQQQMNTKNGQHLNARKSIGQQQLANKSGTMSTRQQQISGGTDLYAVTVASQGQQQLNVNKSGDIEQHQVTRVPTISVEERKLLDEMVSSKPAILLNQTTLSTGQVSKTRKMMKDMELKQNKITLVNIHDTKALMEQGFEHDMVNPVKLGRDIYEEGEEDELLSKCRAEAARKGDLSPMYSGKKKKAHTRKKSWDGKMNEDVNIRRLPMRVAKQKQVSTTSTKSTRSKKKT